MTAARGSWVACLFLGNTAVVALNETSVQICQENELAVTLLLRNGVWQLLCVLEFFASRSIASKHHTRSP
jgi:hypothetical protein